MANLFSTIVLLLATAAASRAYDQEITITGKFYCFKPKPATSADTWVAIENDRLGKDDKVELPVKDDGTFSITLKAERAFELDPEFKIYTDCNDGKPGQRKLVTKVPPKHVGTPGSPKPPYDAGTIDLQEIRKGEDRDYSIRRSLGKK